MYPFRTIAVLKSRFIALRLSTRLLPTRCKKIGVTKHELQPDWLAGQCAAVAVRVPGNRTIDPVAIDLRAVSQREAANRLAVFILHLHPHCVGLAIWPILLDGILTLVVVAVGLVFGVAYYWRVFAVGAIAGVAVTRLIVLVGTWLDAKEPS